MFTSEDRAILILFRSFGWFFCQELARTISKEVIPVLSTTDVKLACVGIGTYERSQEFVELTEFPSKYLYVDPDNAVYDALDLVKSVKNTFFDQRTPLSLAKRFATPGKSDDLIEALSTWKPWIPPKLDQGYQQGGAFVFQGQETLYGRKDPATGDHADLNVLLNVALSKK